ncbi:HAMP domain-containing histidine kinase [Chitinophaga sp. G-6-1-13]|uniref:histidine kinase n=1 Tax=Chitinophaga fulva TaxID=2728842 RepID=A0A848GNI4_9BACT|nr:HAMP domain-containing sensor histidine kinase [Chitinophaga fulva]NML40036.1 HAMP domain-containing histidine kinase [Chitinophaga fulva]
MKKLLNFSLKRFIVYASVVLAISIPVYYFFLNKLWQYELAEHDVILTDKAVREDSFLIIGTVTLLTVIFFFLLMGGLLLLNRSISRRLWQPFYDSLSRIKDFDLNKQNTVSFGETNIVEFAELNKHLHKLISGSVAAYKQQKEFADNASHELQTPLAIVQSKLDLLLQSQSLTDEQYNIIEDAGRALTRVGRINKNLLLLARIDNSQYMDTERVDLSTLLDNTISAFREFAATKQIIIKSDIAKDIEISSNRGLLDILVNNLLNNAIRHSAPDSMIEVTLSGKTLVFSNAGDEPLQYEQLFKRFSSASSQTPGTGLGLALVKQIADRYNWQVNYTFADNHHIFSLTL